MTYVALTIGGHYLRVDSAQGEGRVLTDGDTIDQSTIFERVDLSHGRVALRTLDGRYLTMLPDEHQNFGLFPQPELTPAAAFEERLWPNGQVSLRSHQFTYVGAHLGKGVVTVNRTDAMGNERFFYVDVPGTMVPTQRTSKEQQPASSAEGLVSGV